MDRPSRPPEDELSRREFLRRMALAGAGLAGAGLLVDAASAVPGAPRAPARGGKTVAAPVAASRGRYLEFSGIDDEAERLAAALTTESWRIRVDGLVNRERDMALEEFVAAMPLETRQCAAARSVGGRPSYWSGFPLAALVRWARPQEGARYLHIASFVLPHAAPNQARASRYPWPYREGLTLADATDPRAFVATGLNGHALPPHRGAPLRLVLPWKRGSKGVKAITRFEFTARQPRTFWGDVTPRDYDFSA